MVSDSARCDPASRDPTLAPAACDDPLPTQLSDPLPAADRLLLRHQLVQCKFWEFDAAQ
eukprot:EC717008.1.p3 GENE.EC717008.1~~EC717008.1.p3  ORF type:complete len:59 (+),score=0.46 EC717008.1:255-431(+)